MLIPGHMDVASKLPDLLGPLLQKKHAATGASSTLVELATQWTNPTDVTSILMVIGGDVVQKALAQTTGNWFTPVCFSFGWVAYAFTTLVNVIGDGRLLPPPDYPVKVINVESGHSRENKNWVVGRIVRDTTAWIAKQEPLNENGIRITIFEAENNPNKPTSFSYSRLHLYGALIMILQLCVAGIPIILDQEWGILFITGMGTLLALISGSLPQWRAEKLPNKQTSRKTIALTAGNGSKDIMIVKGAGRCLDLEELAVNASPRGAVPWLKFVQNIPPAASNEFELTRSQSNLRMTPMWGSVPRSFWVTRCVCTLQSVMWLLLLINVAGPKVNTWFLLAVGAIGMFQNAVLAAVERPSHHRNLPLRAVETIVTSKVMDGLMDLEVVHGWGAPLLREFFQGRLRDDEKDWWDGKRRCYDDRRSREKHARGPPSKPRHYESRTAHPEIIGAREQETDSSPANSPVDSY
jgi:hypothetical protein